MLYIIVEKNLLSKTISPKLSLDLQNVSVINFEIAKTLSVNKN